MNTENRYQVTASLFMLREMKHRQEQVKRGYVLLRRKAEALRMRGRQAANELAATQAVLGHTLREAYISLAAVKFANGESNAMVLENVGEAQVRVKRIPENISGVATVVLQAMEDPTASDTLRYAGLGAGGHRTSEAKKAFREAVRILIKFASLRNTCILLDAAIKTTLRKVNGIEKVIMPKLRNTEKYILMEMDEREREEFHRLKMVKAKKIRSQSLTNLRNESARRNRERQQDNPLAIIVESEDDLSETHRSECHLRSLECMTTSFFRPYGSPYSTTGTDSSGDFKPACLPHNWEDDDLLF